MIVEVVLLAGHIIWRVSKLCERLFAAHTCTPTDARHPLVQSMPDPLQETPATLLLHNPFDVQAQHTTAAPDPVTEQPSWHDTQIRTHSLVTTLM